MPSGNFTKQWIFLKCPQCDKEIKLSQGEYNFRLKRNKTGKIFCSTECRNIAHRTEDNREIKLICSYCNKDFTDEISKYDYNRRIKNPEIKRFCSVNCSTVFHNKDEETIKNNIEKQKFISCPQRGRTGHEISGETKEKIKTALTKGSNGTTILLRCDTCGKEFLRKKWQYDFSMNRSITGKTFCSNKCALTGRIMSEETKLKIKISQLNIPENKLTDDIVSHEISKESRIKMALSKAGISTKTDWDIVLKELEYKKIKKYSLTRAPIPDAIWIDEEGKLVALELEKKPWFTAIKSKMNMYYNLDLTHHNGYDKVYLVWYTLDGVRREEWLFEDGEWNQLD